MEGVKYWELVDALPEGSFYKKQQVIPYKVDAYKIVIDTLYPLATYEVSINGELYYLKTDVSGLIVLNQILVIGNNEIKWRKLGESIWEKVEIETSNIGTILGSISSVARELEDDVTSIKNESSILTAARLTSWRYMYGAESLTISREQMEEILQALWNTTGKQRSIKQIAGTLYSVPVTTKKVGEFVLNRQWIYNNKYEEGLDGFNIVGTTNVTIIDDDDFGRQLRVQGQDATIYPFIHYGREEEFGSWVFQLFVRWGGLGSGNITIGYSLDGVTWTWLDPIPVTFSWKKCYTGMQKKPRKVAIQMNGTYEYTVNFSPMQLYNQEAEFALPQILGKRGIGTLVYNV